MSVRPVSLIPGENRLGKVSNDLTSASLVFSTDTSAYASADLVADTQEITGFFRTPDSLAEVLSVTLIDQADQAASAYNLVFMVTSTSLGTENSAPNISDANLLLGFPRQMIIPAANIVDWGGASVYQVNNVGLILKGGGVTTSIYAGIINGAGTPTFAAASLKLEIMYRKH